MDARWIGGAGLRALVSPLGASLRRLVDAGGRDVVWGYTDAAQKRGAQGDVLAPWPNRVRDGTYSFRGVRHALPRNDKSGPNAIHGLVRGRVWEEAPGGTREAAFRLRLEPSEGYPFTLELAVIHTVADDGYACSLSVRNLSTTPAPFGAGFHPYLVPRGTLADAMLEVPATLHVPRGADLIPDGEPAAVDGTPLDFLRARTVGDVVLDHTLTGLRRGAGGRAVVRLDGAELWMGPGFTHVQLFSGDTLGTDARRALAVEPMTCGPDAFNQPHQGLRVLEPGEGWSVQWGIRPRAEDGRHGSGRRAG